ncbi:PAP2 family protein, partial [Mesorhizobium sp. M00.F.Ca.ET.186.01.1.1]
MGTSKERGLIFCGIVFAVLGAWMFRQYITGQVAGMDQAAFSVAAAVRSAGLT